jgi:hypothetical protein
MKGVPKRMSNIGDHLTHNITDIGSRIPRVTNPVWYGGWETRSFSERELTFDDDISVVSDDISVSSLMSLPALHIPSFIEAHKSTSMQNSQVRYMWSHINFC